VLPTPGRYRSSSIVSRPDYTWPGGKRLAVSVAVNIEAFGYGIGKGVAIAPPGPGAQPRAGSRDLVVGVALDDPRTAGAASGGVSAAGRDVSGRGGEPPGRIPAGSP
jgi:hypothetical protein